MRAIRDGISFCFHGNCSHRLEFILAHSQHSGPFKMICWPQIIFLCKSHCIARPVQRSYASDSGRDFLLFSWQLLPSLGIHTTSFATLRAIQDDLLAADYIPLQIALYCTASSAVLCERFGTGFPSVFMAIAPIAWNSY